MNGEWWQEQIPDGEDVLWVGQPDQGLFPLQYGWAYKVSIILLIGVWAGSPWIIDSAWDFWKIFISTIAFPFLIYGDRLVRTRRVYVVTSRKAWEFNKDLKSKDLEIDRFLDFSSHRTRVTFDRHPFFSFNNLSDPDAALKALTQAREAST